MIARVAAIGALALVIVLVALVLLGGGPTYTLHAYFQDASGLVSGDQVLIGPAPVGAIQSIGLSSDGEAEITLGLNSDAAPMHEGTVARIYDDSLSGIANHYITLQPGPTSNPPIPNGGVLDESHTYSSVSLDQLFDAFDPLTRAGLRGYIRGSATAIQGRALEANRTLLYFAPGLQSTSNVTAELTRNESAFDGLLVQGAQALQQLASRSQQLTQLIANGNATTAAIASQSQSLQEALALFPGALTHSTRTFAGLETTLDALDPLVAATKANTVQLTPFATELRTFANLATPTTGQLNSLVQGLTALSLASPGLAKQAGVTFPNLIQEFNNSQHQLDALREYTPDVVGALTNLGQVNAYYDANGHYARTQPSFFTFGLNGSNDLTASPPFTSAGIPVNTYNGLQVVHGRCPGGAMQPTPDGSAPWVVPGCKPTSSLPGP